MTTSSDCTIYRTNPFVDGPESADFNYNPNITNPRPVVWSVIHYTTGVSGASGASGASGYSDVYTILYLTEPGISGFSIAQVVYTYDANNNFTGVFTPLETGFTWNFSANSTKVTLVMTGSSFAKDNIATVPGDRYEIELVNCSGNQLSNPRAPVSAQSVLTRSSGPISLVAGGAGGGFSEGFTGGCSGCACFTNNSCGNVRVPIITIQGQTTFDSQYLADMLFTICDDQQYYKCKPLKSCCGVYYIKPEQVLQTQFRACGIELQKVVKGANTLSLNDKLLNIYNQFTSILGPSFYDFYQNFILYAMAKYILARVLYGDFNLDYLYKSFNRQFLEDLSNSRFCGFLTLFEDCNSSVYGFNQFFKSGHKEYSESIYNFRKVNRNINKGCGCK